MRIITGSVRSTPIPWLHVLSNIAPPPLRRERMAHNEWFKCMEHPNLADLSLRHDLSNPPPHRLVSRNPIWKEFTIQNREFSITDRWKVYWDSSPEFGNKFLIENPSQQVEGFSMPRKEWKTVNSFRTGHGCSAEKMF